MSMWPTEASNTLTLKLSDVEGSDGKFLNHEHQSNFSVKGGRFTDGCSGIQCCLGQWF